MSEQEKGQIMVFLPLAQQILFAPAIWQAEAQQLMTAEAARPKGPCHAATSGSGCSKNSVQ